jgi:hypothetical protein
MNPRLRKADKIVLGIIAGLLLFGLLAGVLGQSGEQRKGGDVFDAPPATLSDCHEDSIGRGRATVTVTNPSNHERTFYINVTFKTDDGIRVGEETAVVRNVPPGETAADEVSASLASGHTMTRCILSRDD